MGQASFPSVRCGFSPLWLWVSLVVAVAGYSLGQGELFAAGVTCGVIVLFGKPWVVVALDEGGVRIRGLFGIGARYRSYSEIAGVALDSIGLHLLDAQGRRIESFFLDSPVTAGRIYPVLAERLEARRLFSDEVGLGRGHRSLDTWLHDIAKRTRVSGDAYRRLGIDFEAARRVASDANAPADVRAGALFALIRSGNPTARDTALSHVNESSPPLVIAVAGLAAESASKLAQSAIRFLSPRDRRSWRSLVARNS